MQKHYRLSIVVPMYNEAEVLERFFARVCPIAAGLTEDYEIVCIDDGSRDSTLAMLAEFNANNPRIKVVSFSRNFGKESALAAGLDSSTGDAVVPIDADLQDPPEVIPELVAKWLEGYDMVLAVRESRSSDSAVKRMTASMFYRMAGRLSSTPIHPNAGDFRLMDRRVVEALRHLPERNRFAKGLFGWLGFRQAIVTYSRPERAAGETKWKYWRLWNYALDGIFSFSTLPLRVWTYLGMLVSAFAMFYMAWIIVRTLVVGVDVPGYASLLVVMLFFSGLNMVGLGMLGEYLGRVFIEVKQRPLYLVDKRIGFDHE
jgi:polyisoprenyl-phosphate glycosyltransferase